MKRARSADAASRARDGRRHSTWPWSALLAAGVMAVTPLLHVLHLHILGYSRLFDPPVWPHILINSVLTAVVAASAIRFKGRLDRRIASVLGRGLLLHGSYALVLLVSRDYYSNQVMLTAVAASAVVGIATVAATSRRIRPLTVLIGDTDDNLGLAQFDRVDRPDVDLRRYDLILTNGMVELSPEWGPALTQAMLAGVSVRHYAEYVEELEGVVSVDHFELDHLPAGGLTSYRVRKRISDIVLVLLLAPIALPLLAVGAAAVAIGTGRPVFYIQDRLGMGGQTFRMIKLRTMRSSRGDEVGTATATMDARVTRVGAILRRFRIDELPQLLNVLRGDMSFIGPRPEQPGLAADYTRIMPGFAYRSLVRPGITGWAQVNAGYAANLAETRVKLSYDLFYVKNFSFALDLQILMRTILTVAGGAGVR